MKGGYQESKNIVHPNKKNVLMSAIIVVLILILALQIWLLWGTLNKSLEEHNQFILAGAGGSLFLFLAGLFLLKYLPGSGKDEE